MRLRSARHRVQDPAAERRIRRPAHPLRSIGDAVNWSAEVVNSSAMEVIASRCKPLGAGSDGYRVALEVIAATAPTVHGIPVGTRAETVTTHTHPKRSSRGRFGRCA
jgi:hypothetical protein